ncbi:MAG TPA: Verru_Chthon cassette protein A [Prosthecobacter sp.]|nr:Verru_Chthon cassette protein A [Prosthecobacter sp.]HRK13627.1 Verru_Chthon cassette protein A [Prosthecobacter sp.]
MKQLRSILADARRHQGLALIIVLSMLALATIVILAFLSVADTEHKATITYSSSQTARRLADTAVNMVVSQIRAGSERETAAAPVIHATQPGAVRKYSQTGIFIAGYKLFSDKDMIFRSPPASASNPNEFEQQFVANSEPPANWNRDVNIARFVDINEPVIKGQLDASGNSTTTLTIFPVLDPRAAQDIDPNPGDEFPVEGFSYNTATALRNQDLSGASDINPEQRAIVLPGAAGGSVDSLRLAMPVQWLYILRDGAVGYLDETLRFQVLAGSSGALGSGESSSPQDQYGVPSETNPIVGRVAFWTDDESCKVNINTASEPTYTGQPIYYHERDQSWADFPPARSEYQRFPGHPATVALSSVLYPNPTLADNRSLDTYGPRGRITGTALSNALAVKERLYDLIPRIHTGGSLSGTRSFEQDAYRTLSGDSTNATAVAIQQAAGERLYASVDELLFSQRDSDRRRVLNNAVAGSTTLFNRQSLERSSAFLTAHSRASEVNMFGLPRVAMWPVSERQDRRTGFDNLIEFCTRLGSAGNNYIFQRTFARTIPPSSSGASYDINIQRNQRLMAMLDALMNKSFPAAVDGAGGAVARSYVQKYGQDNTRQLLVQIFDYIRSTNLYDSYLIPQNRNNWPTFVTSGTASTVDWTQTYRERDRLVAQTRTYTDGVARNPNSTRDGNRSQARINDPFEDRFLPGHGQVTPAEWSVGGRTYRGFGRFVSISEIGLQFICTADGQPDMYSWRIPMKSTEGGAAATDYQIPVIADEDLVNYVDYFASSPDVPNVSGGRTALKLDENVAFQNTYTIRDLPLGNMAMDEVAITNLDGVRWAGRGDRSIKDRYYSNFPPLNTYASGGLYNTTNLPPNGPGTKNFTRQPARHPGYRAENWNHSLEEDTPLKVDEKRVQALLHLEFFCPSVGYGEIIPDMTFVISANDISNIEVDGKAIFSTTQNVVIRTERPLFETDGTPEVGGFASFRKISLGRRVKGMGRVPDDTGYDTNATSNVHSGVLNMDLVSSFFTVNRNRALQFSSPPITVNIYDTHDWQSAAPVQVVRFRLSAGQAPTPDLVCAGSYQVNFIRPDGTEYNHPLLQAPRWWGFHRDGVLGRSLGIAVDSEKGRFNRDFAGQRVDTETRAHNPNAIDSGSGIATANAQSVPGARALIYARDSGNYVGVRLLDPGFIADRIKYGPRPGDPQSSWDRPWHFGSDVVRAMQPAHGDARILFVKRVVEPADWTPHRFWNDANEYMAHNFSSYTAGGEPGFDRGTSSFSNLVDNTVRALPPDVTVSAARSPDAPHGRSTLAPTSRAAHAFVQRYYDFDDSDPGGRVGSFINKPDEGNYAVGDFWISGWTPGQPKKWRATYFRSNGQGSRVAAGQGSYFTPNRMISSPVMFGSLPTRMWDNNGEGAWTNALFRPHVQLPNGVTGGVTSDATHPGETTPPDHYLLDLFWMPVVEPYAISESLSTAGKINMNYQMMPFTHIRRATAVHAVMKGEVFAALPNTDYELSKDVRTGWGTNGSTAPVMRNESLPLTATGAGANRNAYWHRTIAIDRFKPTSGADQRWWQLAIGQRVQGTLRQFEERFNFGLSQNNSTLPEGMRGGLFRTASQICELHLIPNPAPGGAAVNVSPGDVTDVNARDNAMGRFWAEHCSTGDNTRERPYSNLYARLTTRSNTFRVHVRAQSIRKSLRSVDPAQFDPDRDVMTGEFRGSFLVERYIDQGDLQRAGNAVDYANASDPFSLRPLEDYYRFRVIESKRFAP